MKLIREKLSASPALARVAPFIVFVGLTALQGQFGEESRYWIYFAKTLVGIWLIWLMRPLVAEMKWAFSWAAVIVGVLVFAIWVGLDGLYPSLDELWRKLGFGKEAAQEITQWNPHAQFGIDSAFAWFFVIVRIAGSTLVVPPLEEVFYRSFLYRWIAKADFLSMPLGRFNLKGFLVTALIFGFAHHEWLAGILCAFAYQGLVIWKNRLGDAMTAHAITNLLLGLWVVWRGAWNFW